jgi:hypothetical protein
MLDTFKPVGYFDCVTVHFTLSEGATMFVVTAIIPLVGGTSETVYVDHFGGGVESVAEAVTFSTRARANAFAARVQSVLAFGEVERYEVVEMDSTVGR